MSGDHSRLLGDTVVDSLCREPATGPRALTVVFRSLFSKTRGIAGIIIPGLLFLGVIVAGLSDSSKAWCDISSGAMAPSSRFLLKSMSTTALLESS